MGSCFYDINIRTVQLASFRVDNELGKMILYVLTTLYFELKNSCPRKKMLRQQREHLLNNRFSPPED